MAGTDHAAIQSAQLQNIEGDNLPESDYESVLCLCSICNGNVINQILDFTSDLNISELTVQQLLNTEM